jgi:hypothetical protein
MQLSRDGGTRHRRDGCTRRRADGACVSSHCGHAMAGRAVATYGSNRAGRSRSGDMNGRSFRAQFRRRRTSTDVSGRTAKPLFSGSNPLVASTSTRNTPQLGGAACDAPWRARRRQAICTDVSARANLSARAGVAELADAADLNSAARKGVRVRTPVPAPASTRMG